MYKPVPYKHIAPPSVPFFSVCTKVTYFQPKLIKEGPKGPN